MTEYSEISGRAIGELAATSYAGEAVGFLEGGAGDPERVRTRHGCHPSAAGGR